MLQKCSQVNLKLNKDKCHFRCTSAPFFGETICWHGVKPDPPKIKALIEMPSPKNKKKTPGYSEYKQFLGKFSLSTASVCEPL